VRRRGAEGETKTTQCMALKQLKQQQQQRQQPSCATRTTFGWRCRNFHDSRMQFVCKGKFMQHLLATVCCHRLRVLVHCMYLRNQSELLVERAAISNMSNNYVCTYL